MDTYVNYKYMYVNLEFRIEKWKYSMRNFIFIKRIRWK